MKLQHLTVIFIIIVIPVILLVSLYISTGLKTIKYQSLYDTGLLTATHDAIYAFEINTANSAYSDNAETKRTILKSSVKAFEKSLCNTCGISSYNTDEIEEYIPALVFGMYDGFYMYAPSYNSQTGKYEHNLKNYVYYSELLDDGTSIIYSLDNYVIVSGEFGIREGYLINDTATVTDEKITYNGVEIDMSDPAAVNYYKEAVAFTEWFLEDAKIQEKEKNGIGASYLNVHADGNDPEDENSSFVQHKRTVIKEKIESVLNSSITAYSERTWGYNYKMPKLSEEDWEKIYSNISMISFFQGKQIGFTKYNGYCVLNSTNSNEYVNPNLMYFINGNTYHDIRCSELEELNSNIKGYKIGDFEKRKVEEEVPIRNDDGTTTTTTQVSYKYNHNELACYSCINGQLNTLQTVNKYVNDSENSSIKSSYWTSLARERYKQVKLLDSLTLTNTTEITVKMMFYQGLNPENIGNEFRITLYENGIAMEEKIILNSSNCEQSSDSDYGWIWTYVKEDLDKNEEYSIDNPLIIKDTNNDAIEEKYGLELIPSKDEEAKIFTIEIRCSHSYGYNYNGNSHICKLCGQTGQEKHNYIDEGNRHVCSLCDKQHEEKWINDNPSYHACEYHEDGCEIEFGNSHTLDSGGNCTVCGYHQHSYTDRGTLHVCVCGDSHTEEWETTEDNNHKCKHCTLAHDPYADDSWKVENYDTHWCIKCESFWEYCDLKTTGTCPKCGNVCQHYPDFLATSEGSEGHRCSGCNKLFEHEGWWAFDEKQHVCYVCGYMEAHEMFGGECDVCGYRCSHDSENYRMIRYPTCTETGEYEIICEKCGNMRYDSIAAEGHHYEWINYGSIGHRRECQKCGDGNKGNYQNHNLNRISTYEYECTICHHIEWIT